MGRSLQAADWRRRLAAVLTLAGAAAGAGCTTVHVAGGQSGVYLGLVRVVSDAPSQAEASNEAAGVVGLWREHSDGSRGGDFGLGWRSVRRIAFQPGCRVLFQVKTDQQLERAAQLLATSENGGGLCIFTEAQP